MSLIKTEDGSVLCKEHYNSKLALARTMQLSLDVDRIVDGATYFCGECRKEEEDGDEPPTKEDTLRPAFPTLSSTRPEKSGMSLREYYAGQYLSGMGDSEGKGLKSIAFRAVLIADILIAELDKDD